MHMVCFNFLTIQQKLKILPSPDFPQFGSCPQHNEGFTSKEMCLRLNITRIHSCRIHGPHLDLSSTLVSCLQNP